MNKREFYAEISDEEISNLFFKRNIFDIETQEIIINEVKNRKIYSLLLEKEEKRKTNSKIARKKNFFSRKYVYATLVLICLFLGYSIYLRVTAPKFTASEKLISNKHTVPIQSAKNLIPPFSIEIKSGNLLFSPVAKYSLTGMIVSKKRYSIGWESKISPIDFAMAWGLLQEKEYLKKVKYTQRGRWYFYKYKSDFHMPEYISFNSANTHIIPATENLKKALLKLRKKDTIKLEGYLVNISGTYRSRDVWWNTSTSRNDTGNGACEIFYITELRVDNKLYK